MVQCCSTGDSNVSSHEGTLAPPDEYDWTCAFFGPLKSTTETPNRSVQPFLHRWLRSVPILYNGLPVSHSKLPLPIVACRRHIIRGSLGPPESAAQMATWSFQPFFLQGSLVWHTDRATDRPTDHARVPQISSKSVHLRRSYSRMREHHWNVVLLRFQNVSCRSVLVGFAEKTSVFGSV